MRRGRIRSSSLETVRFPENPLAEDADAARDRVLDRSPDKAELAAATPDSPRAVDRSPEALSEAPEMPSNALAIDAAPDAPDELLAVPVIERATPSEPVNPAADELTPSRATSSPTEGALGISSTATSAWFRLAGVVRPTVLGPATLAAG